MRPTKHLRYLSIVCLGSLLEKVLFAVSTHAQQFAYVTNSSSSYVSVIDTATNSVTATIGVGARPIGVGNSSSDSVSVIDTASNTVIATVVPENAVHAQRRNG